MTRSLTYAQAINEAIAECMAADNKVYLVGLGVPGPTGVFGTTTGLVVESHEVIDIQSGSADGLKSFYPGMRSVPIVVV